MATLQKLRSQTTGRDDNRTGQAEEIQALKDWSEDPQDNTDRAAKLGQQRSTLGALICRFDQATRKTFLADGIEGEGEHGIWPLEPDNFLFRPHRDGDDSDQVWGLRVIVDENHKHNERENRSTPLINQRNKQHQGHYHDVFKIRDVRATSRQKETIYTAAGEWIGLCSDDEPSGPSPRYHAIFNAYEKAGYITDAETIGQLKHLLRFVKFSASVPTGGVRTFDDPCSPTTPDAEEEHDRTPQKNRTNVDGEPFGEPFVWSDLRFWQDDTLKGPLGIDPQPDGCPHGQLVYGGIHWSNRKAGSKPVFSFPNPANLDNGKLEADLEDSPSFGRKTVVRWLRPWIRIPAPDVPTFNDKAVPPDFPDQPGTPITPKSANNGAFEVKRFLGSQLDGTNGNAKIPEQLPPAQLDPTTLDEVANTAWGLNFVVEFITPSGGFAGRSDLQIDYITVSNGGSAAPAARTGRFTTSVSAITHPGSQTLYRVIAHIPYEDLTGKEGGKVGISFYRLQQMAPPFDNFDVIDFETFFGPVPPAPSGTTVLTKV